MAEPNALMFSKEEMDRIGAMLYREADAALRCLVSSQCEGAIIVEPDLMVSTSPKEHNGQDNLVDPHGGRLEPAGNVSRLSWPFGLCLSLTSCIGTRAKPACHASICAISESSQHYDG